MPELNDEFADAIAKGKKLSELRDVAREEPSFRSLFANANCASLEADPVHCQEFAETLPKLRRELVWSAPASAAAANRVSIRFIHILP